MKRLFDALRQSILGKNLIFGIHDLGQNDQLKFEILNNLVHTNENRTFTLKETHPSTTSIFINEKQTRTKSTKAKTGVGP